MYELEFAIKSRIIFAEEKTRLIGELILPHEWMAVYFMGPTHNIVTTQGHLTSLLHDDILRKIVEVFNNVESLPLPSFMWYIPRILRQEDTPNSKLCRIWVFEEAFIVRTAGESNRVLNQNYLLDKFEKIIRYRYAYG